MHPTLHFGFCQDDLPATARFLRQVQVRDLVCDIRQIPGRKERGRLTPGLLDAFRQPFVDAGISLSVVTVAWLARDAEGRPRPEDLETTCRDIAVLGEAGVPIAQLFETGSIPEGADPGVYRANLYDSYRQLVTTCAAADMQLAIHGGWVPGHCLWNADSYAALFEAVPDPHNGVCFCAGSVYQSGDDVVETARRLRDRIHFVHFRDADHLGGDCPEMLLGTGKVPFAALTRALRELGYTGPVHCEHFGRFGSDREDRATAAWSAGFLRGILQSQ
jgi:sugar phosphate isomerase/epimerase